jgi:hypothetical protein
LGSKTAHAFFRTLERGGPSVNAEAGRSCRVAAQVAFGEESCYELGSLMKDDVTTRARVAPVALIACCVGALVVSACWKTKRNPLYCDGTAAYKCEASRPYCDKTTYSCETTPPDGSTGDMGPDMEHACTGNGSCTVASAPICDDVTKMCRACTTGSNDCATMTATPVCEAGACVECGKDADCATQQKHCDTTTFKCVACNANADCTSGACRADQSCALATDIVYVDNNNGMCTGTHTGTKADPYCDITTALAATSSTILVAGSTTPYSSISVTSGPVTKSIVGPGKNATALATFSGTSSGATLNITSGTSRLSLAGVALTDTTAATTAAGAFCSASPGATASLIIARSLLVNSGGDGVDSNDCALMLDSNEITSNHSGGVKVTGGSYAITNNIIAGNGNGLSGSVAGFVTDSTATGSFAFNTVAKNFVASGAGGIDCGTTSHAITASIVDLNTMTAGTQFAGICTYTNVVAGSTESATGVTKLDPAFVSTTANFRLDMTGTNATTNDACCVDKLTSGPDHDVDQTPRPINVKWDIGAFEAQ